ncbi:MAG TPA: hypothetical protein VF625_14420 [Longimicrobium sp.]|jgi:hypothetical protein
MTTLESRLDRLHARIRANPLLQRFTVLTRILLAIGFVPPALVKIQGERFTAMDLGTPIGFFFEAMYRTGAYWQFIGWAQIAGGILLLWPRTATLGAAIFFPIILNIFVITVSLNFGGTPVIAGLMLLACAYLLCWDYPRWKGMIFPPRDGATVPVAMTERAAYVVLAASGLLTMLATRGYVPMGWVMVFLAVGAAAGIVLVVAVAAELRSRRAA